MYGVQGGEFWNAIDAKRAKGAKREGIGGLRITRYALRMPPLPITSTRRFRIRMLVSYSYAPGARFGLETDVGASVQA